MTPVAAGRSPLRHDPGTVSRQRATPVLVDVLRRYPPMTGCGGRVARLMADLDRSLRQRADRSPGGTAAEVTDARRTEDES